VLRQCFARGEVDGDHRDMEVHFDHRTGQAEDRPQVAGASDMSLYHA
jgi:hypothetical protein